MTQYKIHGYDQLFGTKSISDETYLSEWQAQKKCRRMEWVEEVDPPHFKILLDPSTSNWLREALTTALERDPIDALNDIDVLKEVLENKLADIQK